ncbi:MAG: hypothetical protein M3O15_03130 [Acidobacteriota bacterium]|nr:hypothetical protein [Acidobacteriota bacterium]
MLKPLSIVLMALLAGLPVAAQPALKMSYVGFLDVNGNGILDCGEPITFSAVYTNTNSGPLPQGLSGSLFALAQGEQGLVFQPGSVTIDPTSGCQPTITRGNTQEDVSAQVDFHCTVDAIRVAFQYRAVYYNAQAASFTATAQAATSDGKSLTDEVGQSTSGACTGPLGRLAITKTAAGTGAPGSSLLYTLTVRDLTGLGDGGLQLVEAVPSNTRFSPTASSPDWICQPDNGPGSLCRNPVGNVLPNGSLSRYFGVTIDSPLPAGVAAIGNTACVREGPTTVVACTSLQTPTTGTPRLHLTKTLGGGQAVPGANLSYTLALSNTGNEGAAGITLTETVPANTTFSPLSSPGWTCSPGPAAGSTCTLPIASLDAGASISRTFALTVANPLPAGVTAIANTACGHGPGLADACDSTTVPTAGMPALKVAKTLSSGTATPGTALVYDVAVQNTGNQGAAPVAVSEAVPPNTTFTPAASSPAWTCTPGPAAGSTCTASIPTLAAGSTAHLPFALTLAKPLPAGVTEVANTACSSAPSVADTCQTLTVPTLGHPQLGLVKTYSGGPAQPGATLVFDLSVSNTGDQDAAGAALTETVPAHTTFAAAASSAGWTCSPGPAAGSTCTLPVGTLPAGTTLHKSFAVTVASSLPAGVGQVGNSACLQDASGNTACGQSTTPVPITLTAELRAVVVGDPHADGQARPNDVVQYTLVVTNPSLAAAQALAIPIHLDPHLTLAAGSVTTTAGTVTAGNQAGDTTPTVGLPSLPPGGTVTIVFRTTVAAFLPGDLKLLSSQAMLSGANFPATVSDDPDTPAPLDPTTTPIATDLVLHAIPTLGSAGLTLLVALLGVAAVQALRRRPAASTALSSTDAEP